MQFTDRRQAGAQLANAIQRASFDMVIALPRGGVVVGDVVARALHLPLDIVVPRKIGAPGNKEFAIGAITEIGEPVLDDLTIAQLQLSNDYLSATIKTEQAEATRRLNLYRGNRPPLDVRNKRIVLVDDGIATGYTMLAAIQSLRAKKVKTITVAVPVAPADVIPKLQAKADAVICLHAPTLFGAVGMFYDQFDQVSDQEVMKILAV